MAQRSRRTGKAATRKRQKRKAPRRKWRRWALVALAALVGLVLAIIALFAFVDPPRGIYMRSEVARLGRIDHRPVPLEKVSLAARRAVVAAEDANFCRHLGFDMAELRRAIAAGGRRGASTISQQTVKNVFLWQGRSWPRKALEALLTPPVELLWGKRRILELYLDRAEFGEGIFGIEAAARRYFGKPAARLTLREAARLAAVLPDPKGRDPKSGEPRFRARLRQIEDGARTIARDGRDACFR